MAIFLFLLSASGSLLVTHPMDITRTNASFQENKLSGVLRLPLTAIVTHFTPKDENEKRSDSEDVLNYLKTNFELLHNHLETLPWEKFELIQNPEDETEFFLNFEASTPEEGTLHLKNHVFIDKAPLQKNMVEIAFSSERTERFLAAFDMYLIPLRKTSPKQELIVQRDPEKEQEIIEEPPATQENEVGDNYLIQLVKSGIEHILVGPDHLLFLLAIYLSTRRKLRLAFLLSLFTIAHSITLFLAVLELLRLNPVVVESIIALSISIVAFKNLNPSNDGEGAFEIFVLGLIHGIGFASVFEGVGLSEWTLALHVLLFNVGVEIGQLLFILAIFVIHYPWSQNPVQSQRIKKYGSFLIFLTGLYWFGERLALF